MVHKAKMGDARGWLGAGWRITKSQYPISMWIGLWWGLALMVLPLGMQTLDLPMWSVQVVPGLLLATLGPGILLSLAQISRGQRVGFGKLFAFFTDREIFPRYWPIVLVELLIGFINAYTVYYYPTGAPFYLSSILVIAIGILLQYAATQIILARTPIGPAVKFSVEAVVKNFAPLFAFLLWIGLFVIPVVCALTFGIFAVYYAGAKSAASPFVSSSIMIIPMAFLIMPVLLSAQFAVYMSLFEGQPPDQILAKDATTA